MKFRIALSVLLLVWIVFTKVNLSQAQTDTTTQQKKEKNVKMITLPVLYYSPETRFGLGALASLSFKMGKNKKATRASNLQTYFLYTAQGQIDGTARYTLFTNEEKYVINGRFSYLFFPEFYYGIGNRLPKENEELVSYRRVRVENRVLRKITQKLFVGLQYRYVEMFQVRPTEGGLLETSQVPGYNGSKVSGLGAAVVYDSRDNILAPYKGAYLELSNYNYGSDLGGEFDYSTVTVDLRKYFKLFAHRKHILAIQGYGNFITGTAPYKELSEFGGGTIMRGFYQGRYRQNDYMAAQVEYRLPIWRWIGMTAFTGVGDVASEISKFDIANAKMSYGLGLRFEIDKQNRTNIRVDYGRGSDGSAGFYLEIGEAF
ncbi:BamA/TamA family outer membrane protein [uncultured Microscilla sp.]|uniref:BamA/TamA family outer membrane protein n=1 Tax=uncultured Microscilla sp. TaxID=432653 RepID=UPI00261ED6E8|nr:BamA/TamA family outer membrane protein [uncultured Microscilla sp.]